MQFTAELLSLVDILILNETELGSLTNTELRDTDGHAEIIDAARALQTNGNQVVCVTLGKRGVVALIAAEPVILPGREVSAIDTTGAGDCFVGAVAALLAERKPLRGALE